MLGKTNHNRTISKWHESINAYDECIYLNIKKKTIHSTEKEIENRIQKDNKANRY